MLRGRLIEAGTGGRKVLRLLRCRLLPLRRLSGSWGGLLRLPPTGMRRRGLLLRLAPCLWLLRLALRRLLSPARSWRRRLLRLTPVLLSRLRARLPPLPWRRGRCRRGRPPTGIGGLCCRCAGLLHGSPARQAKLVGGLVLSATTSADDHSKTPGAASIYARAIQRNPAISGPSRPGRALPCRRGCAGRKGGHVAQRHGKPPRSARGGGSAP